LATTATVSDGSACHHDPRTTLVPESTRVECVLSQVSLNVSGRPLKSMVVKSVWCDCSWKWLALVQVSDHWLTVMPTEKPGVGSMA
jgi:hypothetical protein